MTILPKHPRRLKKESIRSKLGRLISPRPCQKASHAYLSCDYSYRNTWQRCMSLCEDKLSESGINSMTTPTGEDPYNNMMDREEEVRKGPWTVEEDMRLCRYVSIHGEGRWNFLSRAAGLRRNGKSCRLRWVNYLRPDVKRGNITPDEERLIADLHARWGNRWSRIAQSLPGRTDNEIKNYWRTRIKRIINGRGNQSSEKFPISTSIQTISFERANASEQRNRNIATALSHHDGPGGTEDIGKYRETLVHFEEPLSDMAIMNLTNPSTHPIFDVGHVDSLNAGMRITNEFDHKRQNIAGTPQFQNERSEALKGGLLGFDPLTAPLKDDALPQEILSSNIDSFTAVLSEFYAGIAVQDHAGSVSSCREWPERVLSSGSYFSNGDVLTPCDSTIVWNPHDHMIHNGSIFTTPSQL